MTTTHQAIVAALQAKYTAPPLEPVKRPIGHRQGLTARLHAIEAGAGGEKQAAAAAGVTPRTWRGWKRNPASRLSARSMAGVEQAYDTDLRRRSDDPVRQLRYALAKARSATVTITAEMQWDGYYNGQAERAPSDRPVPPLDPDNQRAHRQVRFGTLDISRVIRAWKDGGDTKRPMELVANKAYAASIFLNHYYRSAGADL